MVYVRTVKTASGARAVQVVHSSRKGERHGHRFLAFLTLACALVVHRKLTK